MVVPPPEFRQNVILFGDTSLGILTDTRLKNDFREFDFEPTPMMAYHHQIEEEDYDEKFGKRFVTWMFPNDWCFPIDSSPSRCVWVVMGIIDKKGNHIFKNPFNRALEKQEYDIKCLKAEIKSLKLKIIRQNKTFEQLQNDPINFLKKNIDLIKLTKGAIQESYGQPDVGETNVNADY